MPSSARLIKRRIKSVVNTRKITKAMELVAGAKMRKSVQRTLMSKAYARSIDQMVQELIPLVDPRASALLQGRRTSKKSLVIVVASDRGLCGNYNGAVIKQAVQTLKSRPDNVLVATMGKRADATLKRMGFSLGASFESVAQAPTFERIQPLMQYALQSFMSGDVDRVFLISMGFQSAMRQEPVVRQVLPLVDESKLSNLDLETWSPDAESLKTPQFPIPSSQFSPSDILFEPDPVTLLNQLLPRKYEMTFYQAILEASAAEHSARMLAMRNATENASDMLQDLSFTFNQARQSNITREILEITAGKAAIE